jgi:metallophosphoesterase (TIGR03768 family)
MRKEKALFFLSLFVGLTCLSCKDKNSGTQDTRVKTTVDQTLVPDEPTPTVIPQVSDVASFAKNGYGIYHIGAGEPYVVRTDLMPSGYDYTSVTKKSRLLSFFTITDIHLTDEESPAQGIVFSNFTMLGAQRISLYSPLMPYTTQVLDASIKTINKYNKEKPLDLGLVLGDMANSNQYNELRWFINIMDGKSINPDSGADDDPVAGENNDFADVFQAEGLDSSIPWYATIGNHDHFWVGSKLVSDGIRQAMTGTTILQLPNILYTDPYTYSTGVLDCSKPNAPIIGAGRTDTLTNIPTVVADENRHSLTTSEFISEFSTTSTLPVGHGFIQDNAANVLGGCYSFIPKSDIPVKIIVLDNTMKDNDPPYQEGIYGHGSLDNGRYEWLMAQLQAGQDANQLMIIAAHVPIGVISEDNPDPMSWIPVTPGYTSQADLIEQMKAFPNLILFVAGHRHLNTVQKFVSSDASHPENGFWQVETKSLREFPEQFRTFEISRNSDNTISITATVVDPEMTEGSLAAKGREYAIASNQLYNINEVQTGYNVVLVKKLSAAMQAEISKY